MNREPKISVIMSVFNGSKFLADAIQSILNQTFKEFELVLDPFMGSGTTGIVCDELNRSFVGYDLNTY